MWPQPRMGDSVSVSARVERTGERGEVMPGRMERLEKATGQGCAGPVGAPSCREEGLGRALVVGVASAPQVTPEPEPAFPRAAGCRCHCVPILRLIFIQQLLWRPLEGSG